MVECESVIDQNIPIRAFKYVHLSNLSLLYGLSTFLPLPPPSRSPVGEGRIPSGRGLSPGRTGALSPEGRGHSLTDSLADREREKQREREW